MNVRAEILILLHSHYPEKVSMADITKTVSSRNAASVRSRLSKLKTEKLIWGDRKDGYRLTSPGYNAAVLELRKLIP